MHRGAGARRLALAITAVLLITACAGPAPEGGHSREVWPIDDPAFTGIPEGYRVRSGDTLYSIAFRFGLDWQRVARWNRIAPPYTIRPGQWIRLRPDPNAPSPAESRNARSSSSPSDQKAVRKPAASPAQPGPRPSSPEPKPRATPAQPSKPAPSSPVASAPPTAARPASAGEREMAGVRWRWPTAGSVLRRFHAGDARKGILIGGQEGQPVVAAADGEVVYSGNGLIGYGELVIIKHSDRMLSAYAHNRKRLVAEGERVRAGQVIAQMGRNEDGIAVLHFEIRRDGKPVDPAMYLPGGP